ncbi:MAG: fumarylacetoacetate hydrolase family protein [Hyphomicrobiaceae bacterium]
MGELVNPKALELKLSFVIDPPKQVSLPVRGQTQRFPVRRVYCIGRNYAAHAVEMGHDPNKEPPFFFQKNPSNVDASGEFPYPAQTKDVHFELELVVALQTGGRDIQLAQALEHVYGYAVGLDMTRRDLQGEMKKLGRPWEIGKAFERSAPMSAIVPASQVSDPQNGGIELSINGEVRQSGDLNQMIWKIPEMITYLSAYFELAGGDLIMTGTPAGVGAVKVGDVMHGVVSGVGELRVSVV